LVAEKKDTRARLQLSPRSSEILNAKMTEFNLGKSEALNQILLEYDEFKNQKFDLTIIASLLKTEIIAEMRSALHEQMKEEVTEELSRIRMGTNNTDRNSQILLELVTAKIQSDFNDDGILIFSNLQTPEFLDEAKKVVGDRITKQIQKKYT